MTTIADFAGGPEAFRRLAEIQYSRCLEDPVLQEIFGTEGRPDHVEHLAAWLTEVFGGEPRYTLEYQDPAMPLPHGEPVPQWGWE